MKTSMITTFGGRQLQLLTLLLENKAGLTGDELVARLAISRTAVHQHLVALERDGYVEKHTRASSGGRPGFGWCLSDSGVHLFPKQYALFSDLLIHSLKAKLGSAELVTLLQQLGEGLASEYRPQLQGKTLAEQIKRAAAIMGELGYQARSAPDSDAELPLIDARNCVYHHLASEHKEVCELDLALLSTLLDSDIEHVECMVRGGKACRFRVHERANDDK